MKIGWKAEDGVILINERAGTTGQKNGMLISLVYGSYCICCECKMYMKCVLWLSRAVSTIAAKLSQSPHSVVIKVDFWIADPIIVR